MGSTAAIVIAIVAVVAGFLILRSIGDDDDGGGALPSVTTVDPALVTPTTLDPALTTTTLPLETTSTVFTAVTEGATAVVANASTVNGAAGVLTTALSGAGFTMAPATNGSPKQDASTILYDPVDPEASQVAASLSVLMGNIEVLEISTPAPIEGGVLPDGVSIVVMLGNDKANLTLAAMGTATTLPPTTLPGEVAPATT
jgi:hypothetical protein